MRNKKWYKIFMEVYGSAGPVNASPEVKEVLATVNSKGLAYQTLQLYKKIYAGQKNVYIVGE